MNYKLLIGLILLVLCVFIGREYAKRYSLRKKFYYDLNNFNHYLINEITFTKNTIPNILKDKGNQDSALYKKLRLYFIEKKEITDCKVLSKDENEFFLDYLKKVSKVDMQSQVNYVNSMSSYLSKKLNESIEQEKKQKPLCIKLSFMIGLVLLILVL